ncbi:hypothetical protein FQN57_000763, partial [Myotisia sp. PD_48]
MMARALCECGFSVEETGDYYTHMVRNDFSVFNPTKTLSVNPYFTRDWAVQRWGMAALNWATPLPIHNRVENVYIENGQLVLRQEAYPQENVLTSNNVSVASIASREGHFLHGSFRTEFKLQGASGGSVAGFFWYHNDKNEIDVEILAREFKDDSMLVHYTIHPALDEKGRLIRNSTEIISLEGDHPANHFQTHRFDWTKNEVRFYQNSELVHSISKRVPKVSGNVYLNLWADGGMWSGAPSTTDVFLRVKTITIFHNTTMSDEGKDELFELRCQKAGGRSGSTVCIDGDIESGRIPSSK